MIRALAPCALLSAVFAFWPGQSHAEAETMAEIGHILNTFLLLLSGILVLFMAAGFSMLEAGFVRVRNVAMQLTKNIGLLSIAVILYFAIGFNLMHPGDGWLIDGVVGSFASVSHQPVNLDGVVPDHAAASPGANFFFQLMFCAAAASIVSGAMAERIRLTPFLIFIAVLTALIYPIQASWTWGGGFLEQTFGFHDFAGGTIVHAVGGWAALAGIIVLGPRVGKFDGRRINPIPASNLALATLGMFLLWIGWFGFNGGSLMVLHDDASAANLSRIFINTNLAAAAGAIGAMIASRLMFGIVDLTLVLNGVLAGLVSITADPLSPSIEISLLVGLVGGIMIVVMIPWVERRGLDDVVGAVPVHLFCGIWGTLAVVLSNDQATLLGQLAGIVITGVFVFAVSMILWLALRSVIGLRIAPEAEEAGLDVSELGIEAYPEFEPAQYPT